MTEKEKMLKGELYDSNDKELAPERFYVKDLCHEYNSLKPTQLEERKEILKKILGKVGENCFIEQPFVCDFGYNIEVGEKFYANHNLVILDTNKVIFGDRVMIGPNCGIYAAGHPLDPKTRSQGIEFAKPITVGNNVWIGGNVVILPGVTIGDNSVIGAGCVVNKDIPANCVAVGNPCRIVKEIKEEV